MIREDGCSVGSSGCFLDRPAQVVSVKDVVAQDKTRKVPPDERIANQKGLSQPARSRLFGILKAESPLRAVSQQLPIKRKIVRCADHENFADAAEHQCAQRVIHHRFIVHRQQLLADNSRDRVESGSRTSGEDDSFPMRQLDVRVRHFLLLRKRALIATPRSILMFSRAD